MVNVNARTDSSSPTPLTRDSSAGRAPKGELPSAVSLASAAKPAVAKKSCVNAPTLAVFCGVRWARSGARGSHRWQKSTGDVRPRAAGRDERPTTATGLAFPCTAAGRRRSVGSRIAGAKLRSRWRVRSASMTPASTCRRKTSRAVRSASVDEDARGTVLAMCGCDSSQRAHRDSGRQRSRRRALGAAENAASGRCRSKWHPASLPRGAKTVFDDG